MNGRLIAICVVVYFVLVLLVLVFMHGATRLETPQDESASLKREPAWGDSLNLNKP